MRRAVGASHAGKHARDPRPVLYTEAQLENAETHDPLWNAAQMQMVHDRLDAQLPAHVLGKENPGVDRRRRRWPTRSRCA